MTKLQLKTQDEYMDTDTIVSWISRMPYKFFVERDYDSPAPKELFNNLCEWLRDNNVRYETQATYDGFWVGVEDSGVAIQAKLVFS